MEYKNVKGFNYAPSYARNVFEEWSLFNAEVVAKELALGKAYFPKFNTIRLWLSYDEFRLNEDTFAQKFETCLQICSRLGISVIPVLFNRWHDADCDGGGMYIDHFVTDALFYNREDRFQSYIDKIVGAHKNDERILLWDTCNEPFFYYQNEFTKLIEPLELAWLQQIYDMCKEAGASQPVSVSLPLADRIEEKLEMVMDISDVVLLHPYLFDGVKSDEELQPTQEFVKWLKELKGIADKHHKPVLTTETCWGSLDDDRRAEIVKRSLAAHVECGIGYVAHALWYSRVADLHTPEDGVVGVPGSLHFINKDGTIRKGHEVFNEF